MEECPRVQYQLRRVGKQSAVLGVQDLMKITKDVTRFGRHSENDFFLDSCEFLCMVSRWHAELHRVHQAGNTRYMLRDNSLNGTYLNNVRVKGNQVIQEGDVVMFGHPHGKTVKPGETLVSNIQSEFCFVFEAVPKASAAAPVQTPSPQPQDSGGYRGTGGSDQLLLTGTDPLMAIPGSPMIHRVPATSTVIASSASHQEQQQPGCKSQLPVNRRLLSDECNTPTPLSNTPTPLTNTPTFSNTSTPFSNTSTLLSNTPNPTPTPTSLPNTVTILKDISNVGSKPSKAGLLPLELLIKTHGTVSPGHIKPPTRNQRAATLITQHTDATVFTAVAAAAAQSMRAEDSEGSEQDIFQTHAQPTAGKGTVHSLKASTVKPATPPYDLNLDLDSSIPMPSISSNYVSTHLPTTSSSLASHHTHTIMDVSNKTNNKTNNSVASSTSSSASSSSFSSSSSFRISAAADRQTTNRILQIGDVGVNPSSLRVSADKHFLPIPGSHSHSNHSHSHSHSTGGKVAPPGGRNSPVPAPSRQQSSPSWRDSPATPTATTGRGVKRPRSETPTRGESRGESPSARGLGKSKKRRKGKRWTQVKKRLAQAEEEEEGNEEWHFDGDLCDSVDCYRPAGNTVSWVACDDCEKWYHTVCVGTSFDAVRDSTAEFHCGCM